MKIQERNRNYIFIKDKKFKKNWNGIPAIKRLSFNEQTLPESLLISFFWHILAILLVWLISFLLLFFGITPKLFPKPKNNTKNIEFILNGRKALPKPPVIKKTIPQIPQQKSEQKQHAPKAVNHNQKAVTHNIFSGFHNKFSQTKPSATKNEAGKAAGKKAFGQRPGAGKSGFRAGKGVRSSHAVSRAYKGGGGGIPDFSMSKLKTMNAGAGGTSHGSRHYASGFDASTANVGGVGTGSGSGSGRGSFNKTAARQMVYSYDISPYVNELRRRVSWNWKAPQGAKRVEVFIRIAKDGRIVILNIKRTSEMGNVDNAAERAVRKCVPLAPLPSKYSKSYLDIVFVFNGSSVSTRY